MGIAVFRTGVLVGFVFADALLGMFLAMIKLLYIPEHVPAELPILSNPSAQFKFPRVEKAKNCLSRDLCRLHPRHQSQDIVLGRLFPRQLADDPPVAHHQNPRRQIQHLRQLRRNQHDRHALLAPDRRSVGGSPPSRRCPRRGSAHRRSATLRPAPATSPAPPSADFRRSLPHRRVNRRRLHA